MSPTIRHIAEALEAWAPPDTAQSYDNVGLLVGDAARPVQRALIALDLTPGVIDEAVARATDLILTHHPLIFRPLKRITSGGFVEGMALRLAESGIALYSIHTNLDAARGGVSYALAERLGLVDLRLLDPMKEALYKLVTFVPPPSFGEVFQALSAAGAEQPGVSGGPGFATQGRGYVVPDAQNAGREASNPVDALRLEVDLPRWRLAEALSALREVHPSRDPAYDVYPIEQPARATGFGVVGQLPQAEPLAGFLARVAARLDAGSLRYVGGDTMSIQRVAVCGGSGSDLIRSARSAGADAFVTADVTYHKFFEVLDGAGRPSMALIDPGHYETEAMTEALLQGWLAERFPRVEWRRTTLRTSPIRTFIPS